MATDNKTQVPISLSTYWNALFGKDNIFASGEEVGGPPVTSATDFLENAFHGVGNAVIFPPLSQVQTDSIANSAGASNAKALGPNATPAQQSAAFKQAKDEVNGYFTNYVNGSASTDLVNSVSDAIDKVTPHIPWMIALSVLVGIAVLYVMGRAR